MIYRDVDMTNSSTLRLISTAAAKLTIHTISDIQDAINFCHEKNLPMMPLGDGSNVILSSTVNACILDMAMLGIDVINENSTNIWVRVGAGENWHEWVTHALSKNWFGLENLALIPGRVGAAPIQNIGAYGIEVASYIDSVEYVDLSRNHVTDLSVLQLKSDECQFSYRNSIFKQHRSNRLITSVTFCLDKVFTPHTDYPSLRQRIVALDVPNPHAVDIFQAVINLREKKLPDPKLLPNAGSFFKNVQINPATLERLLEKYPSLPFYEVNDDQSACVKLPAAWLIEYCGFKGQQIGSLVMHANQALVLINKGLDEGFQNNTAEKVLAFADTIIRSVRQEFDLTLDIEPQFIE